ncbi:replication-associated protein [Odonata-associated circular virus-13]|uniref:Replication-associated protein n=1 Tax=Odonata-associated circular virus-13 TaxID=1592113 RepID=A0A0B4UFT9_9VIRU|nr:replication-associated protein [Odonata-associated circular virus-13]AJD07482.1 replication-associated protein [Odonata-associated circular virus-13]
MGSNVLRAKNGSSGPRRKYKLYCFTSFAVDQEPSYDPTAMQYLIYGRETCPDSGRTHLQGFVAFKNRQYFTACKKYFGTAHVEACKGTFAENQEYCKKDGDYKEFGTAPEIKSGGDVFNDVLRKAEAGSIQEIKDLYPGLYIRYKKTLESIKRFNAEQLEESCGIWLTGPPRSGKDYAVSTFFSSIYSKMLNKWFDGYEGEECVHLSDMDKNHVYMGSFLKIWCDRYPFRAEIKGGTMVIRPKYIVVTSNYKLEDIFDGSMLSALQARFMVMCYDPVDGVVVTPRPVFQPSDRFIQALQHAIPKGEDVPDMAPKAGPSNALQEAEFSSSDEFKESQVPKRKKKL